MKSYLELIPISAKVRRRQTRMTRLCILFSVFLVSVIFGMADMYIRSMKTQTILSDGAWHAVFPRLNEEQTAILKARPEVKTCSRYAVTNYHLDMDYRVYDTTTFLCGLDEEFFALYPAIRMMEGTFPEEKGEALGSADMKESLGLSVGDRIEVTTPEGPALSFTLSGFIDNSAMMQQSGAYGLFLNPDAYLECFGQDTAEEDIVVYVEFAPHCRIQKAIKDICGQLGLSPDEVGQNAKLLGLMLQTNDNDILFFYVVAGILAVLVAFSGMLMIMGSLNSNVAQRTEFFGMLRCLGATGRQVRKYVRREALSWCAASIPAGLLVSVVVIWILCLMLKRISPVYFGGMPNFAVSLLGLGMGTGIGILTVLAAARTPAKKAGGVSPMTAVSGNADTVFAVKRAADTRFLHVETALGIHHAIGSKKNLLLLTGSFSLSIILFLGFGIGVDFMHHALTRLRPYTPDVSVVSRDNTCSIPLSVLDTLKEDAAVKRVFGRSFAYNLPAAAGEEVGTVNLISYEEYQFDWARGDLQAGSMEEVKAGNGVLVAAMPGEKLKPGDVITLETALGSCEVAVGGLLGYSPFDREDGVGTVICSEGLFRRLTGEEGYTIIDIQLKDPSDSAVNRIHRTAGEGFTFSDSRRRNSEIRGIYYAFALFVYGFLAVIALIAVLNIINSIAMSVSARMRQYGAMRSIGITLRQLKRMVVAETAAYMGGGIFTGLLLGLLLHAFFYHQLITKRWGDVWRVPVNEVLVIAAVILLSAVAATVGPLRRIREMSVVETIGTQ